MEKLGSIHRSALQRVDQIIGEIMKPLKPFMFSSSEHLDDVGLTWPREDEGKRYLQMELEEQGIPASSQPEPAGYTEETCTPLPNETDHSRYCAPYMPSPEPVNPDRGSPNTDSGCEMSPFEDDLPNRASESTSSPNGVFSFSQYTDLNEVCSKGVDLAMEHGVGEGHSTTSAPRSAFSEGELYDFIQTTMGQGDILSSGDQNQDMVVDISDGQEECPSSSVPQPVQDVLVSDVEMVDASGNNTDVQDVYQGSDPQETQTPEDDGTCVRLDPSVAIADRQRKSEIGNGILRALLNEEKEDILLSPVAFKKATKEKEEELTGVNPHTCMNLNVRVTDSANLRNGGINGSHSVQNTMVDEHAAKLMLTLGANPQDLPASLATVITQNCTSPGTVPNNTSNSRKSLLHQLVASPREQRNTILQMTKATSGATNTLTQQPNAKIPRMSNTANGRTHNGINSVNNVQATCVLSESRDTKPVSCLAHLLLSDMNFSPNQGSDVIMEMEKTREKIAHINLQADSPLLKQLLVGTIDRRKLASGGHSQEVLRQQSHSTLQQHNLKVAGHAQSMRPSQPHQQQLSQAAATSPSIVSSLLSKNTALSSVQSPFKPHSVSPATATTPMSPYLQQSVHQTAQPRHLEPTLEDALASLPEFSAGLPDLASGLSDLASHDDMGDLFSNFTPDSEGLMLDDMESLLAGSDVEVDALLAEEARQTELWYSQLNQNVGLP